MPCYSANQIAVGYRLPCSVDDDKRDGNGYEPVKEVRNVQDGMSQIFRLPDQLPVASVLPSDANLT